MAAPPTLVPTSSDEAAPLAHPVPTNTQIRSYAVKPETADAPTKAVADKGKAPADEWLGSPAIPDRGKLPIKRSMSPPFGTVKRARESMSIRIGSPVRSTAPEEEDDPDGQPALFKEVLDKNPGLATTIEKLAAAASARRNMHAGVFIGNRGSMAFQQAALGESSHGFPEHLNEIAHDYLAMRTDTADGGFGRHVHEGGRMMPGRWMIGSRMDPVPFQRGRSFVRIFNTPFKNRLEVPMDFWLATPNKRSSSLMLYGDIASGHRVLVEHLNGKCYITHGWTHFVDTERVARNDIAVFVGLESNNVLMRLYAANGAEKPWIHRPAPGHADLEDFHVNGPAAQNPDPDNVHVPNHLLQMVYEFGTKVVMTAPVIQTIANAWHMGHASYPLYVCRLTPSQVGPKAAFYFCRRFSRLLHRFVPVTMYLSDSMVAHEGILVRHIRNPDVARLVTGWNTFALWAGLESNVIYVIRIWEYAPTRYELRFYRAE